MAKKITKILKMPKMLILLKMPKMTNDKNVETKTSDSERGQNDHSHSSDRGQFH